MLVLQQARHGPKRPGEALERGSDIVKVRRGRRLEFNPRAGWRAVSQDRLEESVGRLEEVRAIAKCIMREALNFWHAEAHEAVGGTSGGDGERLCEDDKTYKGAMVGARASVAEPSPGGEDGTVTTPAQQLIDVVTLWRVRWGEGVE